MRRLATKLRAEFLEILPPTLYFFVMLHLVAVIRMLMDKDTGLHPPASGSITVAAFILGKAVVIADLLPFINHYPEEPLIWNISWKTAIYVCVALVVHYLEHLYDFWKAAPGVVAANQRLFAEIVWPHFWATQILLALLILMYCVMSELVRVLGAAQMTAMFFGPPPAKPG